MDLRSFVAGIAGSNPDGGSWMFLSCECYVLLGRGLCDGVDLRSFVAWTAGSNPTRGGMDVFLL